MALPVDRRSPTDCKGGWFYVNGGSITVIAYPEAGRGTGEARITRAQLSAALKLMNKRSKAAKESQ